MKIERINENKIKVLIDAAEAERWNVTLKSINENTPEMQEMFWTAIRMAEESVRFSVAGAKLFVEAVRDAETNGFGMLITRVMSEADLDQAIEQCSYRGKIKKTRIRRQMAEQGRQLLYRFAEFDNVCAAVSEIGKQFCGASALYKYQSSFYLYLLPEEEVNLKELEWILGEFGEVVLQSRYMHGCLHEYGERMIPCDAVDVLSEYFAVC